ncbi:MAG: class I SAM-dependent methyltransferase [Phototrophicaceae bacterium]
MTSPQICDYENSTYRTDFWEGRGREYEDRAERIALQKLLPTHGTRLLEIGAGFGRLSNMYTMYEQVIILDYSLSQLQFAQETYGRGGRFIYVAADAYQLPFRAGIVDGVSMIRVIHHMREADRVLGEVRRVIVDGGRFILEHANKRNLKAILRHAVGQQDWNPYDLKPHEFVALNIDFHPQYMQQQLTEHAFQIEQRIPVSFLRLRSLKQRLPIEALLNMERVLQQSQWMVSPSIFIQSRAVGESAPLPAIHHPDELFVAPQTHLPLQREGETLVEVTSGQRWAIRDGIYDFKAPLD